MSITKLDDYIASVKQVIAFQRSGARTTIANDWFQTLDLAGQPGAGTLAGGVAAGTKPTDATSGYPTITNFAGGAIGYLTRVAFAGTALLRIGLFDRLMLAGTYGANATTTITATYGDRLPGNVSGSGGDATGIQLWLECVTAGTLGTITITYTNSAGTGSRTTAITPAALTVGRNIQFTLQAGDTGVQSVQSVQVASYTSGTYNLSVLRPLWTNRVPLANFADVHDFTRTGMPQVFDSSALLVMVNTDSTSLGITEMSLEIASN